MGRRAGMRKHRRDRDDDDEAAKAAAGAEDKAGDATLNADALLSVQSRQAMRKRLKGLDTDAVALGDRVQEGEEAANATEGAGGASEWGQRDEDDLSAYGLQSSFAASGGSAKVNTEWSEEKRMQKFVELEMERRRREAEGTDVAGGGGNPGEGGEGLEGGNFSEQYVHAIGKTTTLRSEKSNEGGHIVSSTAGIAEVPLDIREKVRNIEAIEEAKQKVLGIGSFAPAAGTNVAYEESRRNNAPRARRNDFPMSFGQDVRKRPGGQR